MNRRADSNHALEFAAGLANDLKLPLLVYEDLMCSYPYASDRFHRFILEGVPENARRFRARGAGYIFHLRRKHSDPDDAVHRVASEAAALVTDDYPLFGTDVAKRAGIPVYAVDSSCVVPMRLMNKKEYGAYTIRPKIRKLLAEYLMPVERVVLKRKWKGDLPPFHTEVDQSNIVELIRSCEIDHRVAPALDCNGGRKAAERRLSEFARNDLRRFSAEANEPSAHATSRLSPYLHFGQMSSLETALAAKLHAAENGYSCDEFLEQLIVRRELAFNHACFAPQPDSMETLPDWARKTLAKHAGDMRDPVYSRQQFEAAATHDPLWNATQKELLLRGRIHGYYRMYWGKKIMEWSATMEEALETMVYLHDRFALDGQDPNTYANILWCFGLHDRPWQERPVFGMVRYMTYEGMRRKTDVDSYLREIGELSCA
jgi:deoxyribodipyrimidine photo-lyase